VPYALSYMRALQIRGVRVLNGADAFALELSKTAQAVLLRQLGVPTPRVWTFNDLDAIRARAAELSSSPPRNSIRTIPLAGSVGKYSCSSSRLSGSQLRVISHGRFNLCPAPVCNPEGGEGGVCEIPAEQKTALPVEFYPYREVPARQRVRRRQLLFEALKARSALAAK
jgi:hypothetical protein